MRIAQVAPLYESVPPRGYGGTERIVSYLTEALVAQGHDVTLFASADSRTAARLVPCAAGSLRPDPRVVDPIAHHVRMVEEVFKRAEAGDGEFDLVHWHIDYLHFLRTRRSLEGGAGARVAHVTTLHGRLDIPDLVGLYEEFVDMPVVSISDSQREPLPWLRWAGTVHHGIPADLYTARDRPGEYVAFVGRISPEKGVVDAIRAAQRAGVEIRIAAKIGAEPENRAYFEEKVAPLFEEPGVRYVGEISDEEKDEFLGNALAVMFLIEWPEPFGLAMIEAMACGTPVIARRRGSVGEVVEDGVTGMIVGSVDEAAAAIGRARSGGGARGFDRRRCRARFEERFTASRMAAEYVRVYERVASERAGAVDSGGVGVPESI